VVVGGTDQKPSSGGTAPFVSTTTGTTTTNTTGITINNVAAGSASPTPMRTIQPTVITECVVVVQP